MAGSINRPLLSRGDTITEESVEKTPLQYCHFRAVQAKKCSKRGDRRLGIPSKPIEWDDPLTQQNIEEILHDFSNDGKLRRQKILSLCNSKLKVHMNLFLEKLFQWEKIPIEKSMTKEEIFFCCLSQGPAYADYLKDLRFFSLKSKITKYFFSDEESRDFIGYDSFFKESDLIHWKSDTDDFEWSLIPERFDPESKYAKLFFEKFREIVRKTKICNPTYDEVLFKLKNAASFSTPEEKTTVFRELNETDQSDFCTSLPCYGKRQIVDVQPGGVRDTVIPDIQTLLKIKHSSLLLLQLCEKHNCSVMCSPTKVAARLNRVMRPESIFLMMDFRKIGLTCPRSIYREMGKILEEEGHPNFLEQLSFTQVLDGDDLVSPDRGYCLGWLNEVPTLIQCLLFDILKEELKIINMDLVAFNDDGVWRLPEKLPESIWKAFSLLLSQAICDLDLFVHPKKAMLAEQAVFCEEYFHFNSPFEMKKRQIFTSLVSKCLCSDTKVECLGYLRSALSYYDSSCEEILDEFVKTLEEYRYLDVRLLDIPSSFGGVRHSAKDYLWNDYNLYYSMSEENKQLCHSLHKTFSGRPPEKIYDLRKGNRPKRETQLPIFRKREVDNSRRLAKSEILEKAAKEERGVFYDSRMFEDVEDLFNLYAHSGNKSEWTKELFQKLFDNNSIVRKRIDHPLTSYSQRPLKEARENDGIT